MQCTTRSRRWCAPREVTSAPSNCCRLASPIPLGFHQRGQALPARDELEGFGTAVATMLRCTNMFLRHSICDHALAIAIAISVAQARAA